MAANRYNYSYTNPMTLTRGGLTNGVRSVCPGPQQAKCPKPPTCQTDPSLCPKPPSPCLKEPTRTTATFDGKRLQVRLKCPARFKPSCLSKSTPVALKTRRGKPMATRQVTKKIASNKWIKVSYLIKPAFRNKVQAMTKVDAKCLFDKQSIRSRKVGSRKNRKASTVFHVYRVRVQG